MIGDVTSPVYSPMVPPAIWCLHEYILFHFDLSLFDFNVKLSTEARVWSIPTYRLQQLTHFMVGCLLTIKLIAGLGANGFHILRFISTVWRRNIILEKVHKERKKSMLPQNSAHVIIMSPIYRVGSTYVNGFYNFIAMKKQNISHMHFYQSGIMEEWKSFRTVP